MNNKTPPSWRGIYNYNEIKKYIDEVHENKIWLNKIKNEYKNIIKKNVDFINFRPCNINIITSIYNIKTIIDFGGSNGWAYHYLKNYLTKKKIIFNVFEKEEICKVFSKKNKEINYISDIDRLKTYDFFYTNSTIQYILNEKYVKNFIKKTKAKYLMFDDLFAGQIDDFYSLQKYYEYKIPVKFRNIDKFNKMIKNLNYRLIFNEPYIGMHRKKYQKLPMNGFKKNFKLDYSRKLFFIKND